MGGYVLLMQNITASAILAIAKIAGLCATGFIRGISGVAIWLRQMAQDNHALHGQSMVIQIAGRLQDPSTDFMRGHLAVPMAQDTRHLATPRIQSLGLKTVGMVLWIAIN
jgi:hypothetical protein